MAAQLDHVIVSVNDIPASVAFYTEVLGFAMEGEDGPFTVIRVSPELTLQLAPWKTQGGMHLAFAMTRGQFDDVFRRIREGGIGYSGSFHTVGDQTEPNDGLGARGMGKALYFFDPSKHLLEIRHYES
jgi:catechol 2,3-dioxygenase-like lactoylglutathione lyase family enzyme